MTKAALRDWGVPDWSDECAYPQLDDLTPEQWHWELRRRLKDYRSDWIEWSEKIDPQSVLGLVLPSLPRFPVTRIYSFELEERWNQTGFYNPSNSAADFGREFPIFHEFGHHEELFVEYEFDLRRPLEKQIDSARGFLKKSKETRGILRARLDREFWPLYLRAVDARDAGLVLKTIGYKIFGQDGAAGVAKAKHALERAEELAR